MKLSKLKIQNSTLKEEEPVLFRANLKVEI
jgi:hypothetical protein